MHDSIVFLDEDVDVRIIQKWSQALEFITRKPERTAFYRKRKSDYCEVEVSDMREGKWKTTLCSRLKDLHKQAPSPFNIVLRRGRDDQHQQAEEEMDAVAIGQHPPGESPPVYLLELVALPNAASPLHSAISSAIFNKCRTFFPVAIVKMIRDYAIMESLLEECLDLLLVQSVRIFIGQHTWKLRAPFPRQCNNQACEQEEPMPGVFEACTYCEGPRYCSIPCEHADWRNGHSRECGP